MTHQDPLQLLSIECATQILQYLSAKDITQCEGVSRGWRTFVRHWIASSGLRQHFHDANAAATSDPDLATKLFKKLVVLCSNIERGEPTSVRKYEKAKAFTIVGKFCSWLKPNEGVFWQDLSHQDDGSLYPVQQLDIGDSPQPKYAPGQAMMLSSNGYLLLRFEDDRSDYNGRHTIYTDSLFCLKENRRVWTHVYEYIDKWDVPVTIPLLMGEKRVYYGTIPHGKNTPKLMAYALESGTLLYEVDSIEHTRNIRGFLDTSGFPSHGLPLELLQGDEDELLLIIKRRSQATELIADINLINGADGSLVQTFMAEVRAKPYTVLGPDRRSFALISYRGGERNVVRIQKFAPQADAKFAETRYEVAHLQDPPCDSTYMAIDPFTYGAVTLLGARLAPHCLRIMEASDTDLVEKETARRRTGDGHIQWRPLDRCLTTSDELNKITLPPKTKRGKQRRPFGSKLLRTNRQLRFIQDHRVVLACDDLHGFAVWTVYLFDFGPRTFR